MMEQARSNLCKNLKEILSDQDNLSMLPYFIQHMEEVRAIHLVQFWFSVEAFRAAAELVMQPVSSHHNSSYSNNLKAEDHCSCDAEPKGVSMTPSLSRKSLLNDKMEDKTRERKKVIQSKYHWETSSFMAQRSLCIESDAVDIYTKYISMNAPNSISVSDTLRRHIEVAICPEDGSVVKEDCFDDAQHVVFHDMESRHYPQFCRSRFLSKYQLEYISGGLLSLTDILLNYNTLFYFMEFMEGKAASVLLQFWSNVENYKTLFRPDGVAVNSEEAFDGAMTLYNRYLSLQATHPIDVGDVMRIAVENKMCDVRGVLIDTFNTPQRLVYDKMKEIYYPLFLQSDQYSKYLCELLYMIDDDPHYSTAASHHSDAAAHMMHNKVHQPTSCDQDDPNELWRRPHSLMRFGYITKFGQFVSEAEPGPSRHMSKQGHRIKRSLYSILGREDHSMDRLAAAQQQAEKIIDQVLTLTQSAHRVT